MYRYVIFETPRGWMSLGGTDAGLQRVTFPRPERGWALLEASASQGRQGVHEENYQPEVQAQLRRYFAGEPVQIEASLDLSELTDFQQQVLRACARIGYGEKRTYGELAKELGRPRGARAVGQALGRNPLPMVVPCHRVLAADGSLGGFGAGIAWKMYLLKLEGSL